MNTIDETIPLTCHLYKVEYYSNFESKESEVMYVVAKSIDSALEKWKDILRNAQSKVIGINLVISKVYLRKYDDIEI